MPSAHRCCLVFPLLALIATLVGCGAEETTHEVTAEAAARAEALCDRAGSLLTAGDVAGARRAFREARDLDPTSERARLGAEIPAVSPANVAAARDLAQRAQRFEASRGPEVALAMIEEARRLDPASPVHRRLAATLLARMRRFVEAEAEIRSLLALVPDDVATLRLSAEIAAERGDLAGTLGAVERLFEVAGPDSAEARDPRLLYLRAVGLVGHQEREDDLEILQDLVRRHPRKAAFREALADRLETLGRFDEAVEVRAPLLDCEHPSYRLLMYQARALEKAGRLSEADEHFFRAAEIGGASARAPVGLARVRLQRYAEAEPQVATLPLSEALGRIDRLLEVVPEDPAALEVAARLARRLGKPDLAGALSERREVAQAKEDERRARFYEVIDAADDPRDADRTTEAARRLLELERPADAVPVVNKLLLRHPDHPGALEVSVELLRLHGRIEQAYWEARRLAEAAPESPRGPRLLVELSAGLGRPGEAVGWGERALRKGASDPELLGTLLACYERLGDEAHRDRIAELQGRLAAFRR